MSMTAKERMRRALRHEPVDCIPFQVNFTAGMGQKLAAFFGVSTAELASRLGNSMIRVDITFPERLSEDGKVRFDWWGAGFDTGQEGYFPRTCPLAENKNLDTFPWPDPTGPNLLDQARRIIESDGGEHFITPNFGFALFERAWSLRGFDSLLMDIPLDEGFVSELLDRITEIQLILIRRFIDLGMDGGYFGDDYGAQQNMLFSPVMWRRLIKPRLRRLFAPFLEEGLPVLMHSDGQIQKILPDLVEIGLTALNPVQPEVLPHTWLKSTFGDQLAYYGGVSTQTVLPYGTPDQVKAAVRECARQLAPDRTGLVIAPSHRMTSGGFL
ncbi:MAG TPA: uroporphyrinogen decarboxylase family protein [Anaerolineales bacterium]